ncbi:MAG TPA: tRNA guanosine(34) transglycosylase Tgt [Candidatus Paceibacterota bacterium]|nr:tRNA guanosine(34) transglycosylase Tgt [Candidatus Paceibacterota bacterium]
MTEFGFQVDAQDPGTRARAGRLTTAHGLVETPSYVVVGTNGDVRTLEPEDIPGTRTQIIIANTFHLWRELGDEGLDAYPGLHAEMGWPGPLMTDSGGFQVFSFGASREHGSGKVAKEEASDFKSGESLVRVTDSGVYFRDPSLGGEEEYLDAEKSIVIQEQLGADIIFAFDEPSSPLHDHVYTEQAMERTHRWAERCLEAKGSSQALYGIVQGGAFEDLRRESARFIGALPFHGFGIGGAFSNSFGDTREKTMVELEWTIPILPPEKPRHLLGIGRIEDLFLGVEAGIDTFDCVIPTREARHGAIWTARGRYDIQKGKYADDGALLEADCACPTCANGVSRRELRQLFKDRNPDAGRFATIHNIWFFNDLMAKMRAAILEGRFGLFKDSYLRAFRSSAVS